MIKKQFVSIILCTYNGQRYIKDQLESYVNQSCSNWELFVYDDGSTDSTSEIIAQFQEEHPANTIHWMPNPEKRGFAQNFIQGIKNTPDHFDFYALSDQDDVWCESKLARAETFLNSVPSNMPAVYCSRTTLVDADLKPIGLSPLFTKPPSFRNALVQSIAGGNTMVLNKAARALLVQADTNGSIVSHDWFIYQLVTGAGGLIYYDRHSEMLYRQHESNIIGSNLGFFARLYRMTNLFNGTFKTWMDKNLKILIENREMLSQQNQLLLDTFVGARNASKLKSPYAFWKMGLYRQRDIDTIALFFAWVLGRL